METRSKEELCEEIGVSLLDLEDSELVKIANQFLTREVTIENGTFKIGASDFQPIRRRHDREEVHEVLSLDGKRLQDGDRLLILFPDNTEYEAVLEASENNNYSSKDNFYFIDSHHGVNVHVYIAEGMRAKWVE